MRPRATAAAAAVAVGIGIGAALVTTGAAPSATGGTIDVAVSDSACGSGGGWHLEAGPVSFELHSSAAGYTAVYLLSSAGDVVAETPLLDQGDARTMTTSLTGGDYTLRCVLTDDTALDSGPVRVTGEAADGATGFRPMRSLAMVGPVRAYTRWVTSRLPGLLAACRRLDTAVARDDLAAARREWLLAHLAYERLGAAYGAFGDLGDAIDGAPDGLPRGTRSPRWRGFLAIEHALWSGAPVRTTRHLTRDLVASVSRLVREFPSDEIDPGDLPRRAHEILEDGLELQLSGVHDFGSGTTLATTYAQSEGTIELLDVLSPLLRTRAPHVLADARHGVVRLEHALLATRSRGRWASVRALSPQVRRVLDADAGAVLETLAQIPAVVTPRNGA